METIRIGEQEWMIENLNVSCFRNGESIEYAKSLEEFVKFGNEGKPAYCIYEEDPKNEKKFGKLYNYFAVIDPRGLAPEGFHIPTYVELKELISNVDSNGSRLKSDKLWKNEKSINDTGFSAIPGGIIRTKPEFIGNIGTWWLSQTIFHKGDEFVRAKAFELRSGANNIVLTDYNCSFGLSIRCIKNNVPKLENIDGDFELELDNYGIVINVNNKSQNALLCFKVIWKLPNELERNKFRTFITFNPENHEVKIIARGQLSRSCDGFKPEDKYADDKYLHNNHEKQQYYDNNFMPFIIDLTSKEYDDMILVEKQNWWKKNLSTIQKEILNKKEVINKRIIDSLSPYLIK
jgi:uncharacterized protein (TIGR02145 family)